MRLEVVAIALQKLTAPALDLGICTLKESPVTGDGDGDYRRRGPPFLSCSLVTGLEGIQGDRRLGDPDILCGSLQGDTASMNFRLKADSSLCPISRFKVKLLLNESGSFFGKRSELSGHN